MLKYQIYSNIKLKEEIKEQVKKLTESGEAEIWKYSSYKYTQNCNRGCRGMWKIVHVQTIRHNS